jgi:hypothetical protein
MVCLVCVAVWSSDQGCLDPRTCRAGGKSAGVHTWNGYFVFDNHRFLLDWQLIYHFVRRRECFGQQHRSQRLLT